MKSNLKTGTIKFFKEENNYGFITPDDGGEDVFLSIGTLKRSGYDSVRKNEKVFYALRIGKKDRIEASIIKKLD